MNSMIVDDDFRSADTDAWSGNARFAADTDGHVVLAGVDGGAQAEAVTRVDKTPTTLSASMRADFGVRAERALCQRAEARCRIAPVGSGNTLAGAFVRKADGSAAMVYAAVEGVSRELQLVEIDPDGNGSILAAMDWPVGAPRAAG